MGNAMHGMETRMLLRHCLEGGESKAELARRLGVSRRTIHNWVASGQLDRDVEAGAARYSPRPRPAHKLDPYKGIIDERLSAYPKLSAQPPRERVRGPPADCRQGIERRCRGKRRRPQRAQLSVAQKSAVFDCH